MSKANQKNENSIRIRGARANNLKNVNIDIARDKIVVITGLSGSGKSSLAFDVIYAEGNRRYLEGLSSYARQFLEISAKPDVDKIENLSPTISIDQKSLNRSPRSTVGTLTEIYDYLRILFAKIGIPHCPQCGAVLERKNKQEILDEISKLPENTQVAIMARMEENGKNFAEILKSAGQLGYARTRIGGKIMPLGEALQEAENLSGRVEIIIDRITLKKNHLDKERILDSLETAFKLGKGFITVSIDNTQDRNYNLDFICSKCHFKISEITPRHFSFNNPEGACVHCSGLGIVKEVDSDLIVPNKNLSLAEGAILPLAKLGGKTRGNGNYLEILEMIGRKKGFSINDPIKKISPENYQLILNGCEDGNSGIYFKGVIALIKKKYEDTVSLSFKTEIEKYTLEKICPVCSGRRLKKEYLSVLVAKKSINDLVQMDLDSFVAFLENLPQNLTGIFQKEIAAPLVKEMVKKAKALINIGLNYLSLARGADSISGGEGQRIRLATQIESELSGIIYVLDEPSIGLHNRDTEKLIKTLKILKSANNSLVVVEHDRNIIKSADWIVDMGPGAGEQGGEVIFEGDIKKLKSSKSRTAGFLFGREKVSSKKKFRGDSAQHLKIFGAQENNLKNINVNIPLGRFVSVTGVSGSGKSTLVSDILSKSLAKHFYKANTTPGKYKKIEGLKFIDKVISVDQSPIGRTPRSNAATYTGVFSLIRELFSRTEEAKKRGYDPGRFSFNMKGGRCEDCQGDGMKKIEMHLLPDMYIKCETCQGTRYNRGTLEIEYQGVNIFQVLEMSVSYALKFFRNHSLIVEKLKTLEDVGLGYLKLGQSATNLSGGEAQRIKLATELARKSTGKTLYILDEPTIGLHFEDVRKLLNVLEILVQKGNTVLTVEHNSDVIENSDWIIDLGPEGGQDGGQIVYEGTPSGLKKCKNSWTGKYL
jgi:excinuclease ABC subunit A